MSTIGITGIGIQSEYGSVVVTIDLYDAAGVVVVVLP